MPKLSSIQDQSSQNGHYRSSQAKSSELPDFTNPNTPPETQSKSGQLVQDKQPILELESEEIKSEREQAQTKLEGQLNRLAQLELILNQLLLGVRTQQQQNQAQELEKQAQVEQARQNIEYSQTAHNLADIRLNKALREVQRYRELRLQGVVPETKVLEQEDLAEEKQRLLSQAQSDVKQAGLRKEEQLSSYQKIIHQAQSDISEARLRLQEQEKSYQSLIHSGNLAVLKSEEQLKDLEAQIATLKAEIF
jgi:HlyD family secretion protein